MATKRSGVYIIVNMVTGKVYVGSSVDLVARKQRHFCDLEKGCHSNSHLQGSYNKHGVFAFAFCVIEECKPKELIAREQFWIDKKREKFKLFNATLKAGSQLGIKRSEETKKRMSDSQKGKRFSAETIGKMRLAKIGTSFRKGKKASPETKLRISLAKKGTIVSDKTRKKLSDAKRGNKNSLGFKQSAETVAKRVASANATRERKKAEALK